MKDIELRDLCSFTDTYKMLFLPYFKINQPEIFNLLYGTDHLSRGIVNVYPYWEEQDAGLKDGFVFLVLRDDLISSGSDEFTELINLEIVEDVWYETHYNMQYIILAMQIDLDTCNKFKDGLYSTMFKKEDLSKAWRIFEKKRGGIKCPVPSAIGEASLAKEYHILAKTIEYEKIIAIQLGVDWDNFQGVLQELGHRFHSDMDDETLDLILLTKQIKANGNI